METQGSLVHSSLVRKHLVQNKADIAIPLGAESIDVTCVEIAFRFRLAATATYHPRRS